eukprot:gene1001-1270_t
MSQQQKQQEEIPEFEDLTGLPAPRKNETVNQYFARRHEEQEETRLVFLKEGVKGGLLYSGTTAGGIALASFLSPRFRKALSWNIRTFIVSSGFVAGFWIWGETMSRQAINDRLYREMDQYYNQPQGQQQQQQPAKKN